MRVISVVLAAAMLATPLAVGAAEPVIKPPEWIRRPDPDQLQALWPATAMRQGISGAARLECVVTVRGTVTGCHVLEETPAGMGFGAAALSLTPNFLLKPETIDGVPVETAKWRLTIDFKMEGVGSTSGGETGVVFAPLVFVWLRTPSPEQMTAVWPKKVEGTASGHVVLRCKARLNGRLDECVKLSQQPSGGGFEAAARTLLPMFQLDMDKTPHRRNGQMLVDLPFLFERPSGGSAPRVLVKPVWVRRLSSEHAQKVFPDQAAKAGVQTGQVSIDCVVDATGGLTQCRPVSETPSDLGFGEAAVRVASVMAVSSWTAEGQPAQGQHVRFSLRLNLNDDAPGAAKGSP